MAEERRVVTILFADVAGSTALGDALDPEDVRVLLRRYYDLARETVTEHGGILEKFIGDAVVAVFGFPQTHDDDPQRALAAALALPDRARAPPGPVGTPARCQPNPAHRSGYGPPAVGARRRQSAPRRAPLPRQHHRACGRGEDTTSRGVPRA